MTTVFSISEKKRQSLRPGSVFTINCEKGLKYFLSLALVVTVLNSAPVRASENLDSVHTMSLDQIADLALKGALETQFAFANDIYSVGEFPTLIYSSALTVLIVAGKMFGKDQEATAFTTASVLNMLSEAYLDNIDNIDSSESLRLIPKAISAGVGSFAKYSDGSTYNFYPPHFENGQKMRRPINMALLPIWYGFTNIPNDADTTSAVLVALNYNEKINKTPNRLNSAALEQIGKFRDINRSPEKYNQGNKRINTGAYLTWLYDENNPEMPRNLFAPAIKGQRIPFGKNDVDCVVNANVRKLVALSKIPNLEGVKESCNVLNEMIKNDEHSTCGPYYPNTFNLAFAMASAEKAGDHCLTEVSKNLIIEKILSLQDGYDGFWVNDKNIWEDKILSTAFAMYALLQFGNYFDKRVFSALIYGTHFLLKEIQLNKTSITWELNNFFSAGAMARSFVNWQSEAYTNTIISQVLFKMHKLFPKYKAGNYLKIDIK